MEKPDNALSNQQLYGLWQDIRKLFEKVLKANPEADEQIKQVRLKFDRVVSYITSTREIAGHLFERNMLTSMELETIHSLDSCPIRANTELLTMIMRKPKDVYDYFLRILLDTKQPHIHQVLTCDIEHCDMEHSGIIRRNYVWLVENIDLSNGLMNFLVQREVLTYRECAEIDSERDSFRKNEKLLSVISARSAHCFKKFLEALDSTNQAHIRERLENSQYTGTGGTKAEADTSAIKSIPRRKPPPLPPRRQKSGINTSDHPIAETPVSNLKRTSRSTDSLKRIFSKLSDDFQSTISIKVMSQKTKHNVVHSCIAKTLEEFEQQKNNSEEEKANFLVYLRQVTEQGTMSENVALEETEKRLRDSEKLNAQLMKERNEITIESEKLQTDNQNLRKEIKQLEIAAKSAKEQVEKLREKVWKLEGIEKTLNNYIFKYEDTPLLIDTLDTLRGRDGGLSRLAILDNELYIVAQENCNVDVYDANDLKFKRRWALEDVENVEDIASSTRDKCLYIVSWNNEEQCEKVIQTNSTGTSQITWLTGERQGRLSITHKSNLLLTVYDKHQLNEYSPDGKLLQHIKLPLTVRYPQHSIQIEDDLYVVSYGSRHIAKGLHGVCLVDKLGTLLKDQTASNFLPMNLPVYLSVDVSRNILVADLNNNRVLLLTSDLLSTRELISETNGLQFPRRICLDIINGRLNVACGLAAQRGTGAGQVKIFTVGTWHKPSQ